MKFLAGLWSGTVFAEVYERLYGIPSLERRFREEVGYWVGKYDSVKAELDSLAAQHKRKIEELTTQQSSAEKRIDELTLQLRSLDELEVESTSAISFYQRQMDEAIKGLKNTIEKYQSILGVERVAFESATLKVLEDLKVTREELRSTNGKLLKLLPYFPLIKNLNWQPTKVVNDKIYNLRVSLEAISPLNTLKEVEVKLIPVEYGYFITDYGMRREDYPLVFPPEETRVVKLNPRGLEKEIFEVEFKDLKGGRKYYIKSEVKDVAGNVRTEEIKTSYIREFENLGKALYEKGVIIGASYMSGYYPWQTGKISDDYPLLGRYDANDPLVQWKHIDWAGYSGINVFFIDAGAWEDWKINGVEGSIMKGLMDKGIKCAFQWDPWISYFKRGTNSNAPDWSIDLTYPQNRDNFVNQLYTIINSEPTSHPNYFKIHGKPVIFIYDAVSFVRETDAFSELKSRVNRPLFFLGDTILKIPLLPENSEWYFPLKDFSHYDAISTWAGFYQHAEITRNYSNKYDEWYFLMSDKWREWVRGQGKTYVSSVIPGFKYIWERVGIERSVERLSSQLKYSISTTNFIRIDTWNDFAENTFIEPSQKDKLNYLVKLQQTLVDHLF